jgi:hypothetical protein
VQGGFAFAAITGGKAALHSKKSLVTGGFAFKEITGGRRLCIQRNHWWQAHLLQSKVKLID